MGEKHPSLALQAADQEGHRGSVRQATEGGSGVLVCYPPLCARVLPLCGAGVVVHVVHSPVVLPLLCKGRSDGEAPRSSLESSGTTAPQQPDQE